MKNLLILVAILVGVVLLIIGIIYFIEPAKSLPAFIPGYDPTLTKHHITHGIASFLLGLGCFAFAWFQSGKKSADNK